MRVYRLYVLIATISSTKTIDILEIDAIYIKISKTKQKTMLIETLSGTTFQNRLQAKQVMGTNRYWKLVKEGRIKYIHISPFKEDK